MLRQPQEQTVKLERPKRSSRIYEGRILNLRVDEVELENQRKTVREVVEHRGAAAIVPLLDNNRILLVRQFRYAINSDLLEIPAGTLERDEEPETCATRELEEETGYRAEEISKILECYVAPGYSTEKIHFFLARGLTQARMHTEEDEVIKLEILTLEDAFQRLRSGRIQDAKTACGLYRLRDLL